ncbi:kinase-like domain-containing protein [Chaetomium sp. MPI-SDFR-AT-0129]|nr:kinase-like domain-containing protein [Chaetomium sp. MPI-SDFR-AT-0129]
MTTTAQVEKLTEQVLDELSTTEYACSSLKTLSGGSANFIYKGTLIKPLSDGTKEIAVKHGEEFIASFPQYKIPLSRCQAETDCLKAMAGLPPTKGTFAVHTPKLHYFNPKTSTQVQELLPQALSLKDYALKNFASPDPSRKPLSIELGRSLGAWLHQFHEWAKLPEQAGFREIAKLNDAMRRIKHTSNYATALATVDNYPSVLADAKETLQKSMEAAEKELDGSDLQVTHGDFWTGNTLLPDQPLQQEAGSQTSVFVVDWEVFQFSLAPLDLGQMIAELYELWLYKRIEEGKWIIEGFTAGYGPVNDEFAFRTARHVGTHLLSWGTRVAGWGSPEQVQQVAVVGKDLVVRAWERDRAWFEAGDLACLFASR